MIVWHKEDRERVRLLTPKSLLTLYMDAALWVLVLWSGWVAIR